MNFSDLTKQLQQKSNETQQQIASIQNAALQQFESDSRQLCSSVSTILQSDLEAVKNALQREFSNLSASIRSQVEAERKNFLRQIALLKWMLLLPIGATVLMCGVAIAATWLWIPRELWNLPTTRLRMSDGKSYLVIQDPQWSNCNLSDNPHVRLLRPCKTMDDPQL